MEWSKLDIRLRGMRRHYAQNDFTPEQLCEYLRKKSAEYNEYNIWIHFLSEAELLPYLNFLQQGNIDELPLYGVPFAIKDNIDLAGIKTTAGCEAFAYQPTESAFVVQRLIEAGAIPIGKTNLDQFATGLVGTRSPLLWGPCRNAFNPDYISGGSSSGSAVAVALGLASFSLGTDTAGSGRVPAALNNIIGLKPTKGLLSTQGVVPACRSLDCVSVFALTAEDVQQVFSTVAIYDDQDSYSRKNIFSNTQRVAGIAEGEIVLGIPAKDHLEFYGDTECESLWQRSLQAWRAMGAALVEVDFSPFLQAAKLLYEGPWVAERYLATESLLTNNADAMHPVVRQIIESGKDASATDAFTAQYQLQRLKRQADRELSTVDFLLTPTIATQFQIDEVLEKPIELNSQLGYYTNYMNLLDYSAIALPAGKTRAGVPWGISLVAPALHDQRLMAWAAAWQKHQNQNQTAGRLAQGAYTDTQASSYAGDYIKVAVCGAHLDGQPLNWQLSERGAGLLVSCHTGPKYRLYALPDGKRPALVRDEDNGVAIEIEIWQMPAAEFGGFVAGIPAPLGIGKLEIESGQWVSGFICEHGGLQGATDISEFGGWRGYLKSR